MLWLSRRNRTDQDQSYHDSSMPDPACGLFERLEERIALWVGPMLSGLPAFGILENPYNMVVRMHTNVGNIDVEMFDTVAPATVANFRNYILQGRLDETIFHRAVPGLVHGGAFTFHNGTGSAAVPTFSPINNEFSRLNIAGTIGMWKPAGNPNSATSQFYFNLVNNPHLDTQNGGHTVFGRVIQGWDIVQAIHGLQRLDLTQHLTGPAGSFTSVPVRPNYNPAVGPTETSLVRITDIELIKPWGSAAYYNNAVQYPEGFRGPETIERLDIVNLDPDRHNFYQVIVRYENGVRDRVVSYSVLQPGERRTLKMSDFRTPNYNLVRPGENYSVEVRSSRALAATLNNRDARTSIQESLLNLLGIRQIELLRWTLPGGEKGPGFESQVTWMNLTAQPVTVNMTIHSQSGQAVARQQVVQPFRRAVMDVHTIGAVANGPFSVEMAASAPIVAALSNYKTGTNAMTTNASTSLGTLFTGSRHGILPAAMVPSQGQSFVDLSFVGSEPGMAIVELEFILNNGQKSVIQEIMLTNKRTTRIDIGARNPGLPQDQFFTIRYRVINEGPIVAATYVARYGFDEMTTPFQTYTTQRVAFADGFTETAAVGTSMREVISIFNPFNAEAGLLWFKYDLLFRFGDGTQILVGGNNPFDLAPHQRRDHSAWDFPAVRAKIQSNAAFQFYSVTVLSSAASIPPVPGAVVAQLTRMQDNWRQNMTTGPSLDTAAVAWLNTSRYM
jgi:cyclophilin family peptidyl-prolyl cis-trans isomerase